MSTGAASSSDPPPQPPLAASRLAPGFRFHPTDEELVSYYLKRKVCGRPLRVDAVAEVDLYKCEPWELPGLSRIRSRDLEWYFFSPLDRKYSNRSRTNRATPQGYWKTTGKDRPIHRGPRVVGMKKTLVFHSGRAPRGTRTNWVMHEYRLDDEELINAGISQDAYVVCRIFQKCGTGPQNGAQYGAPFLEEEWEEEEADGVVLMPDGGEDHFTEVTEQEYFEFSDFLQNEELNNQDENASNLVADLDGKDCGSVPDEATTLLDEVLEDTSFTNMVESRDELGHPSNPAPIDQMELKPIIDCLHSQGQPNEKEHTSFTNIVDCVDGPGQLSSPSIDEMEIKPQLVDQTCGQSHPNGKDEYVELNDLANTVDMIYPSTEDSVNYPIRTCHAEKIQGVDENTNLQKMLDVEEFFDTMSQDADQPESLQMPADEANIYGQANELNPFAGGCPSNPHLQGKMVISDAPSDDLTYGQENVELNGLLYSPVIDTSDFDMVDDLLAYFDATNENLQYDTIDFSRSSECMNSSDLSNFNEEVPDTSIPSGASSSSSPYNQSKDKYEGVTVTPDDQMKDTNNKTTRKHLMNMLGSIPASPAFAAEFPTTSGKSIAQISATHSAGPIHVTAGFFHIYGSTMLGNAGQWPLQKDGHADLIFSCSMTVDAVGKGADPEPGTKGQDVAVSMVLRGGLYLFFLSAFILAISYKVGLRFMAGKLVL